MLIAAMQRFVTSRSNAGAKSRSSESCALSEGRPAYVSERKEDASPSETWRDRDAEGNGSALCSGFRERLSLGIARASPARVAARLEYPDPYGDSIL